MGHQPHERNVVLETSAPLSFETFCCSFLHVLHLVGVNFLPDETSYGEQRITCDASKTKGWPCGQPFYSRMLFYIFLRYCPPTSYRACVISPRLQYFTVSISSSNRFPFRTAAACKAFSFSPL